MGFRFLIKAIIFDTQGILGVLLIFLRIQKEKSMILRKNILTSSFLSCFFFFFSFTIPLFQLPLNLMTVPHSLCHLLTPYMTIH